MTRLLQGVVVVGATLAGLAFGNAGTAVAVDVVDARGAVLADVVVYAEPGPRQGAGGCDQGGRDRTERQEIPARVTVVQSGSSISFPNHDSVRHHVYSFSPARTFELKLYAGTPAAPVLFDKAGSVVLGCNIHDPMIAFVQVVDTPWFGKTDATGRVRLEGLPAGDYRLKAQ